MAKWGVGCVCRVTRVVVPKQQERDTWRVSVELALVALGGWREAPAASSNKSAGEREVEPYGRPTPATSLLYRTRNIPEVEEEAETRSADFFSPLL